MTCTDCGQPTLLGGVCVDCSDKRFYTYPSLKAIVDRLKDYIAFECNPAYTWSAKKVYDDLNKIIDPNYKPGVPVEIRGMENDGN